MKKILILCLAAVMTVMSCTDDFEAVNTNTKDPAAVPSGALFANSIVNLFDYMSSTSVNTNNFRLWSQQWAQTTYADESNFQLTERNVNGNTFTTLYTNVIRDLREADAIIAEDQFLTDANKAAQLGMSEVLKVYTYSVLVDIFGDIPYSEAFPSSLDITQIGYDDDAAVYAALAVRLDAAILGLTGDSAMGSSDLIYGGNADSWRKFANSLKLRMAIRMADANEAVASQMARDAIADGVFESNGDNAILVYSSSTPNTNPVWDALVQSGRSDFVIANTVMDITNALNDPRADAFYRDQYVLSVDTIVDAAGDTTFIENVGYSAGIAGDNNSYNTNSHPGVIMLDPTNPGTLMDFSEVSFLLADAAERGYADGAAEDFYNNGISASFDFWNVAGADDYIATEGVAYATAAGDWKEKIGVQKYLAMYNRGFEAWTTYRLYDAPAMTVAAAAGTLPPTRFTYPISEYTLNEAAVKSAGDAMGGDDLFSKVFWDVN